MKKKLTDKHKYIAFVLTEDPDFNRTQQQVAEMFDVAPSGISNAIKEVRLRKEISDLSIQLKEAKATIQQQGILPVSPTLHIDNEEE